MERGKDTRSVTHPPAGKGKISVPRSVAEADRGREISEKIPAIKQKEPWP